MREVWVASSPTSPPERPEQGFGSLPGLHPGRGGAGKAGPPTASVTAYEVFHDKPLEPACPQYRPVSEGSQISRTPPRVVAASTRRAGASSRGSRSRATA